MKGKIPFFLSIQLNKKDTQEDFQQANEAFSARQPLNLVKRYPRIVPGSPCRPSPLLSQKSAALD